MLPMFCCRPIAIRRGIIARILRPKRRIDEVVKETRHFALVPGIFRCDPCRSDGAGRRDLGPNPSFLDSDHFLNATQNACDDGGSTVIALMAGALPAAVRLKEKNHEIASSSIGDCSASRVPR
jgi:hypothetical protein